MSDTISEQVSNQGERILESERPQMVREHKDRYWFASSFLKAQDKVLDCACGSGYGTKILSKKAGQTLGMDISEVAIAYSDKTYGNTRLQFRLGNAQELALPSSSFDVYCSFETIEHVPEPERLVQEAKRVLRTDGTFFVSTPNRVFSELAPGQRPTNPFHFREWSLLEFHQVLHKHFSTIQYYCQRVKSKNKIHPKYLESKFRRLLRLPDLIPLKYSDELAQKLETSEPWLPMVFLAACRK